MTTPRLHHDIAIPGLLLAAILGMLCLHGCGEGIARGAAKGAVEAVADPVATAIKGRQEADRHAAEAVKTAADAKDKLDSDDRHIAQLESELAREKAERARDDQVYTDKYRLEVSHTIRVWACVCMALAAVAIGVGCYVGISTAATPVGMLALITGTAKPGRFLRTAGALLLAGAIVVWVIAPAWYWIMLGVAAAVGVAVIGGLIYVAEHHKGQRSVAEEAIAASKAEREKLIADAHKAVEAATANVESLISPAGVNAIRAALNKALSK